MTPIKKRFRNFLLGSHFIDSRSEYKVATFRGQLAILFFFIGLIYIIVGGLSDHFLGYPLYAAMIGLSILIIVLNRKQKYFSASVVLVVFSNIIAFLFSTGNVNSSGIHVFYIVTSLGALALFGYQNRFWGLLSVGFSFTLFLLSFFFEFSLWPKQPLTETYLKLNYLINYTIAFISASVVINFMIRNHYRSEARLIENEQELTKSRRRYQLAIMGSRAGIWEWDANTGEVYNSPVWKAMLGYKENELGFLSLEKFLELVHPDDKEMVNKVFQNHLEFREPYLVEFRMIRKDKSIIWVLDSGQAVWDENGKLIQMVGSIVDITSRKEAEQRVILQNELLAKTNAELDRFVYSASHDLRSPLSSLLGLINIASHETDEKPIQQYLEMMRNRVNRLDEFIREIISYSQNSRLELEIENVNFYNLTTEVYDELRHTMKSDKIDFQIECPANYCIPTDKRRLRVILSNLISNAIKYQDHNKCLPYIHAGIVFGQNQQIFVKDNGIGIEQYHQPKVFDMFYRASQNSEGSGLGLYIAKEAVAKLGWKISVDSELGKGSKFILHLQ